MKAILLFLLIFGSVISPGLSANFQVQDAFSQEKKGIDQQKEMHPSWDNDGDGINDCEKDGTCDHTVDYSLPRNPSLTPSFDCSQSGLKTIEKLICSNSHLIDLDRELSRIYSESLILAKNQKSFNLKAEQRGWIKGRDDCWKSADQQACTVKSYEMRIAELQARYRLVVYKGPIIYTCDDDSANNIAVMFFQTLPPTLIAQQGDSVSLMYLQPSGSGSKYQGRNESFWEHAGTALITWGDGAKEINCRRAP